MPSEMTSSFQYLSSTDSSSLQSFLSDVRSKWGYLTPDDRELVRNEVRKLVEIELGEKHFERKSTSEDPIITGEGSISQLVVRDDGIFAQIASFEVRVLDPFQFYKKVAFPFPGPNTWNGQDASFVLWEKDEMYQLIVECHPQTNGQWIGGYDPYILGRSMYRFTSCEAITVLQQALPRFGKLVVTHNGDGEEMYQISVERHLNSGVITPLQSFELASGVTLSAEIERRYGAALLATVKLPHN